MSLVGQKPEPRNKFKNSLCHLELLKKSKKLEIIHLFIMLRGIKPLQESDLNFSSEITLFVFPKNHVILIFPKTIKILIFQSLKAIEQMNGKEISPGETITCTIAKPSENNRNQNRRGRGKFFSCGTRR